MRGSSKRKEPEQEAMSDGVTVSASASEQDASDALARQLSKELNGSLRAKRHAERYSPREHLAQEKELRDSSRRAQASASAAPKGQALVGNEVEVFWVVSPADGEQRAATVLVVKGATGPNMDRQLVGKWHSAKVLRAKGCRVELKYTADDWVAWCNFYGKHTQDYIAPEYWREPGAAMDQHLHVNLAASLVVGGTVPEAELKAFAEQVTLSRSTLRTYCNCLREIITKGALFGLEDGALLAAKSTNDAICISERNQHTSGAHRSSLRKFLKFLSESGEDEQAGWSRGASVASRSQAHGTNDSGHVKHERAEPARRATASATRWECGEGCAPSDELMDIVQLGNFERRRKGSSVWEPYSKLICERQKEAEKGWQGLIPVAHVQRDAKAASKLWLFAQDGESIRGNLPWTPSVCSAALAKGSDVLATPGAFYVSVGVLPEEQLRQAAKLKEHLPWERHSLTAFAQSGQGCEDTPAPKRRALLVSCEDETTSREAGTTFVYQPHRSGGLSGRPNLSMTSKPCRSLGEDGGLLKTLMHALCDHNDSLGLPDSGLACVTSRKTTPTMSQGKPVRNIGEGLLYCGGEELKWHHDGNQIADWLTQKDVLSSFILQQTKCPVQSLSIDEGQTDSLPKVKLNDLPAALAIKPHDMQWPQVRLHPPTGSKLDLVGTGKIAEHARKPVSKGEVGASLLVFVGRRMVDEGLTPLPAMTQACPWDGKPVPQPLNDVVPVYGPIPNINRGHVLDSIAAIQKLGSHAHVGFHGRAVSSTIAPGAKSPIARGVQSVIHYNYEMHEMDKSGEFVRFCVYSTPRKVKAMQGDALAFALSGAAGSPIQYFVSGREGSEHAPGKPGQLRYHGIFFVHDWKWINSTEKMDGAALRRDHCSNPASTPTGPHEEGRFHMMAKLKRVRPKNRLLSALEEKMVAKIGVDTRAADEARAKATALKKSVGEEEKRLTQEAASAQAAVKPSQSLGDQLPAGAKASPTLEDSVSTLPDANSVGSESAGTPVAAATTAYTPPGPATVATGSVVAEQQPMKHLTSNELVMASSGSVCNDSSQNERLSLTPRGLPTGIRGLINHRTLDDGAKEYKVLYSDQAVLWRKEQQLESEVVQEYQRKREERRNKRKKAQTNQANAVAKKTCF